MWWRMQVHHHNHFNGRPADVCLYNVYNGIAQQVTWRLVSIFALHWETEWECDLCKGTDTMLKPQSTLATHKTRRSYNNKYHEKLKIQEHTCWTCTMITIIQIAKNVRLVHCSTCVSNITGVDYDDDICVWYTQPNAFHTFVLSCVMPTRIEKNYYAMTTAYSISINKISHLISKPRHTQKKKTYSTSQSERNL